MLTITRRQLDRLVLAYQVIVLVLTLLGIALVGQAFHKTLVAGMAVVVFIGARQLTPDPYHCNSLVKCFALSVAAFALILRVAPSLSWSLTAGPLLAIAVAYSASYIPKFKKYKQYYESQTSFNIDNPTEAEMRARCEARKFTPAETDICVQLFCKQGTRKLSAKEYMSIVGASDEWTARNIKSAYKKRLM